LIEGAVAFPLRRLFFACPFSLGTISMKRKSERGSGARYGDILQATSVEQRSWIGAVILAYNDTERALHKLVGTCIGHGGYSVTSRINGTDGLIAIAHEAVVAMALSEAIASLFNISLSGFAELKILRDSIGHAELFDTAASVAIAPGKRSKAPQDVLLTPMALEGLYRGLALVTVEISQLELIIRCERSIRLLRAFNALDDQRREYGEQDIQDAIARCQDHQHRRRSLPPFPKFPEQPSIDQLMADWDANPNPNKILRVRLRDQ
jgi:hypothetical protein